MSYDDSQALRDYVAASGVEFTLLSDVDSEVIKRYEVFNTIVQPEDVPFYGVPFPGFFLLNEDGVIVDRLFNRHFAHRDGVEAILDSFAGRVAPGANEPTAAASEDDGISVTAFLRGGGGVLRVGPRRRLVVRVQMPDGLHIYGEPVPTGMVATSITIDGPEGFRHDPADAPPTHAFELPGVADPLQVWDGTVDFVMNVWADSTIAKAIADGTESIAVDVTVRYQACDDNQCFIPRSRTLRLEVPLAVSTRPNFSRARSMPGAIIEMDSAAHMKRLIERKTGS
ncbi:MAG: peroxiredoxin family protein [Actinomycetia bacterium]|nr:peroxiredoxin family protein [Actinomycetes bacterium]